MATIIRKDGTRTEISPKNGTDFSLEEFREIIGGGYVEVVPLPSPDTILIVDEEGALQTGNRNPEATKLYRDAWQLDYPHYQNDLHVAQLRDDNPGTTVIDLTRATSYEPYTICGDVLLCKSTEVV
jgi:hypothetical protein